MDDLKNISQSAIKAIENASDLRMLDAIRVAYLGKKGQVTQLLKTLSNVNADQRAEIGKEINLVKNTIHDQI